MIFPKLAAVRRRLVRVLAYRLPRAWPSAARWAW
jgi:hypothetical protein